MEFNDFVMRAAVDEYLRRRAVADYEELLKREINAQVDECESPLSRLPRYNPPES